MRQANRGRQLLQSLLGFCCVLVAAPAYADAPKADAAPVRADSFTGQSAEPGPCPYTTRTPAKCPNAIRVAVGFRLNLGDLQPVLEAYVRSQPHLRIGWPTEVEVSRYWADQQVVALLDRGEAPLEASDEYNQSLLNAVTYSHREYNPAAMPFVSASDPDLVGKLDQALRSFVRVRALNFLRDASDASGDKNFALCLEPHGQPCPASGSSNTEQASPDIEWTVGLRNQGTKPGFFYVLAVDPDNRLHTLLTPHDGDGRAVQPGALVTARRPYFAREGRTQFFVLERSEPFDSRLLAPVPGSNELEFNCASGLEPVLCSALSGANIIMPDRATLEGDGQVVISRTVYFSDEMDPAAGGGRPPPEGYAPWQAQIYSTQTYSREQIEADAKLGSQGKFLASQKRYQLYHRCGGSVIAPNIVLTAAHCVASGAAVAGLKVLTTREVRLGTQDLKIPGDTYRIEAAVIHGGYRPGEQRDDLAVLRITRKTGSKPQVPIKLPHLVPGLARTTPGTPLSVLGWGYTRVVERGERHEMTDEGPQFAQDVLQKADMEIFDTARCRKLKSYEDIYKTICAISLSTRQEPGHAFSCRGDSGGPIIQERRRTIVQVGVVSGGVGCGAFENGQQNPSRFVDLSQYSAWLEAAKEKVMKLHGQVEPLADPVPLQRSRAQ
jgi:hypothetical protein